MSVLPGVVQARFVNVVLPEIVADVPDGWRVTVRVPALRVPPELVQLPVNVRLSPRVRSPPEPIWRRRYG